MDILDVWFDSGSTQNAVLRSRNYDAGTYPADMYLEGSDQHRGWFQSSLLTSLASSEIAPYKSVVTHGFTMDGKGEKMSKSKGNVVAPDKVLKQFGGEILRMWVAMSDYQNDQKISDAILKQMAEQYRKIRNTGKILLGNVSDLEEIASVDTMGEIDLWILDKAQKVFKEVDESFKAYDFSRGLNKLNHFLVAELSNVYIDVCKDKMYCNAKDSKERVASASAMAMIAKAFISTLAPILTFTMDELIEHAPKVIKGDAKDIFDIEKYELPEVESKLNESHLLEAKRKFAEIKDKLNKEKVIKATLELVIYTDSEEVVKLDSTIAEDWFVVSKIIKEKRDDALGSFEVDGKEFEVYKANEAKCPRCWKYISAEEDVLCKRCEEVVN
jgi:isoleucyl-tRNA synthetase